MLSWPGLDDRRNHVARRSFGRRLMAVTMDTNAIYIRMILMDGVVVERLPCVGLKHERLHRCSHLGLANQGVERRKRSEKR